MKKTHCFLLAILAAYFFSLNIAAQTGNWSDYASAVTPVGDIYFISTPEQLAWIAKQGSDPAKNSFAGKTVRLTADIDLGAHWWVPANGGTGDTRLDYPFSGIFDGGYHKIKNLYIKNELNIRFIGLIRFLDTGGIVRNVNIESGNVDGGEYEAGAIVGFNYGKIENCTNRGANIKGGLTVGGIAAWSTNNGIISNCYNQASVKAIGSGSAGGIVGSQYKNSKITGCFNTGEITSTEAKAGGIIGSMSDATSSISGCYNTGVVSADTYGGAIIGELIGNGSVAQNFGIKKEQLIWVASPWEQVRRDMPPSRNLKPVNLKSAINEYEPFRIIVYNSGEAQLKNVNISASDLTGENGAIIPSNNITLYRAHYTNISTPSYRSTSPAGYYPDALIPFEQAAGATYVAAPFSVEKGQNAEVWCDLYVPSGTKPGVYTGTVNVFTTDKTLAEIEVNLTVLGFELPKKNTMHSYFGVLTLESAAKAGASDGYDGVNYKALEKLFHEELIKHRAMPATRQEKYWPRLDATKTEIDDKGHSDVLKDLVENRGFNTLFIAFYYRTEDQKHRATVYFDKLEKWLDELGYLDMAYIYLKDEPGNAEEYETVRKEASNVRSGSSKIKLLCTKQTVTDNPAWGDLYGSVDVWCPLWSRWDEESANQRLALGEKLWSYTALCQGAVGTPWWQIDMAPLNYRSPFWLSWHYGITGFLNWSSFYLNFYETAQDVWEAKAPSYIVEDPSKKALFWGEGMLLYPGQPVGIAGFAPSIRLKLYREAMEEYEYMVLAAKKTQKAEVDAVVNGVVTNFQTWSKAQNDYESAKERLAKIIIGN